MIFNAFCLGQDTLIHAELLNPHAMEEYENEGSSSFRLGFGEEIQYRTKAQFTYKGFKFNYRNEGGEKDENDQRSSLTWNWKNFEIGFGRGQPNIAKGMILGNTMMRFTSALGGQAGVRPTKIGIKSSFQYKELMRFGLNFNFFNLSLFRYDGQYGGVVEIKNRSWLGGMGFYIADKPIYESWFDHKSDRFRISANLSFCGIKFNHLTGDILYRSGEWKFFVSAVALSKDFTVIKTDSKWGSGLTKGNHGFSAGISYSETPWKAGFISYVILGSQYREDQFIFDLRYKKKPFEVTLSLNQRSIMELCTRTSFPFVLDYMESKRVIPKLSLKIQPCEHFNLVYQLQSDLEHPSSYAALFRLNYEKQDYHIRLQISNSRSDDGDLYFIRPLSLSSYAIRKAPEEQTSYIDLLCSKKRERFEVYMLIRNEGINMGIIYK